MSIGSEVKMLQAERALASKLHRRFVKANEGACRRGGRAMPEHTPLSPFGFAQAIGGTPRQRAEAMRLLEASEGDGPALYAPGLHALSERFQVKLKAGMFEALDAVKAHREQRQTTQTIRSKP